MTYMFLKKTLNQWILLLQQLKVSVRVPPMRDRSGSGTPVRESSRSGTPTARLKSAWYPQCTTQVALTPPVSYSKSVWSELSLFWIGWWEQILAWKVWSELAWVAHLILGVHVETSNWNFDTYGWTCELVHIHNTILSTSPSQQLCYYS